MKKCIMSVLAAAAALFVTSCAKDAQVAEVTIADATVTFGVTAPELGSRAFGDGEYARKLTVLVYDKNGYRRDLQVEQTMTSLTTTVEVNKLIKGEKYSFLFWAQSADATCFTLDAANGKVAIDYATAMNNEKVDAFFAQELNMEAKANPTTKSVVLKRPFAQINLGTNDMDAFAANAFAAATSTLTIKHIYNTLDLHDGSVAGVGAVTIPAATIPAVGTKFKVGTADEYNYLALNYVLVEADKALVEVEYAIDNIAGIEAAKTVALQNIPVQRNYRTNLYGSLFTTSATFNVEILPGFVDEFNNGTSTFNMEGVEKIGVNEYNILNATGLANASSQLFAKGGTFNITPDGTRAEGDTDVIDMTGKAYEAQTITSVAGSITINGNGKTIKGLGNQLIATTGSAKSITIKDLTLDGSTITIEKNTTCTDQMSDVKDITLEGAADGSSVLDITAYDPYRWSGVTIKNMTLELGNSNYHGFKHAGEIKFVNCTIVGKIFGHGTHEVYENCTFKQAQNDYNMWVYGATEVDYINCTFIGQGRFLHIYNESGDKNNVTLDGCKFINEATAKSEKAAVEIKIDCVNGKILNSETHINNCTLNDASLFNGLYRLSSNLGADINTSTTVKVYVDGTAVFDNK